MANKEAATYMAEDALSASLEDYLEAIFHIVEEKQAARAKDISKRMRVSGSSVTGALQGLAERELINYAPYDIVTLTPKGTGIAKDIVRRHEALRDFFVKVLSLDETEAEEAACRMEHAVPRTLLERFVEFVEFVEMCPRSGAGWIKEFGRFCRQHEDPVRCEACISQCHDEFVERTCAEANRPHSSTTLTELRAGQRAKVVRVRRRDRTARRIADAGLVPGRLIEVERIAPLRDHIEVKVKGHHVSIEEGLAADITVTPLSPGE